MLAGVWLFASPIVATTLYVGSLQGTVGACLMGAPATEIYAGLWGYNPSLVFAAVAGLFFKLSRGSVALAVCAAAAATVVHAAVGTFLRPVGLPALTFPAAITALTFTLLGASQPRLGLVAPLSDVAVPEDYLWRPRWLSLPYVGTWGVQTPACFRGLAVQRPRPLVITSTDAAASAAASTATVFIGDPSTVAATSASGLKAVVDRPRQGHIVVQVQP